MQSLKYYQRIFQVLCGTSCPFLTGERVMKGDGEQESKVDIVRARKVGRMGDRQGRQLTNEALCMDDE